MTISAPLRTERPDQIARVSATKKQAAAANGAPPLERGDHLSRVEFERRYAAHGQRSQSHQGATIMSDKAIAKKRWSDMSPQQRASVGVVGLLQLALLVLALVDIRRRPAEQIKGSKKLWTLVAFINFVGPIAYFMFGRQRGEGN